MKILLCPEYFYPHVGGNEIWTWSVAKVLSMKGHNIHVITYKYPGHLKDEVINGIYIHRIGFSPVVGLQSYLKRAIIQGIGILRVGLKLNYDLILASEPYPLLLAYLLSKLKKVPIVAVFHDVYGYHFSIRDKGF